MTTHLLILCTHNSARSVLAECLFNHWAARLGRPIRAHSAGSAPSGRINPHALTVLGAAGIATDGTRSKSWDEFAAPGAPPLRAVITVCDSAAAEVCPVFTGSRDGAPPIRAHWGYPDPSSATEASRKQAFELTRQAIGYRVLQLLQHPIETLGDAELRQALLAVARA